MIRNEAEYMGGAAFLTEQQQLVLRYDDLLNTNRDMSERERACMEVELDSHISHVIQTKKALAEYDREHNQDRRGTWITTFSGNRMWIEDPFPADIHIEDIAHGLSNICRFGGQTMQFYSVAQHSVMGSRLIEEKYSLAFLLHDAAESFLGDCVTPLKRMLPDYERLENRMIQVINTRFGVSRDRATVDAVHRMDAFMLATEARDLTTARYLRDPKSEPAPWKITECWSNLRAECEFLSEFARLSNKVI